MTEEIKNEAVTNEKEPYVARLSHMQLDIYQQNAICSCGGFVNAVGTRSENGTTAFVSRCTKCGHEYLLAYEFPRLVYQRRGDRAPEDMLLSKPNEKVEE